VSGIGGPLQRNPGAVLGRHEESCTDHFRCTHGSSLCISRVCGAPSVPVTAAMFIDAAVPHPGCGWRASVLTGLAEEIGSGVDESILARP
jgi:hypothetical protein